MCLLRPGVLIIQHKIQTQNSRVRWVLVVRIHPQLILGCPKR